VEKEFGSRPKKLTRGEESQPAGSPESRHEESMSGVDCLGQRVGRNLVIPTHEPMRELSPAFD